MRLTAKELVGWEGRYAYARQVRWVSTVHLSGDHVRAVNEQGQPGQTAVTHQARGVELQAVQ